MTEISELSKSFYSSDNDSYNDRRTMDEGQDAINNCYTFRCEQCYSNVIFERADFINNIFVVKCNNSHVFTYKSYKDLIDNTNKDLFHTLCHNCKISNEKNCMLKCNQCNLFICNKCKASHMHSNFTELKDIDTKVNINKDENNFNSTLENTDINNECQQILKNIELVKNIKKKYEIYLKELTNLINKYLNNLYYYLLTNLKIVYYYKNNNNYFSLFNYRLFNNNNIYITSFFKSFYNIINDEQIKEDLEKKINFFFKVKKNLEDKQYFSLTWKEENLGQILNNQDISANEKIGEMKRFILKPGHEEDNEIKTKIKCFSPLIKNECLALGKENGEIEIVKLTENNESILKMKVFNNEVKYICELDENLLVASDIKYNIKIIKWKEFKENAKYSIIQTIFFEDFIYSMISLPLLSSITHYHYFCIASEDNISIYKSNKEPKFLDTHDNENLIFNILKKIELYTLTQSLIEINEKYLAAACTHEQTIKFFDIRNNFKKVIEIRDINATYGSNIFTLIPQKKLLIVACTDGFKFISTHKMKKIKSVHCRYSVLCVEYFNGNIFICSCYDKKKNKIKQYEIDGLSYELKKISERYSNNNDEIWKLKKIDKRIFFLDDQYEMNFLGENNNIDFYD